MKQRFLSILVPLALLASTPIGAQTVRVSLGGGQTQADWESYWPSLSSDGRFVAFFSEATNLVPGDTNGVSDVFVRDRLTATTVRVSVSSSGTQADDDSRDFYYRPAISADGRFVAFKSSATNLVPGDTNGMRDVFVHDLATGTTIRASVNSSGAGVLKGGAYPALSHDGRFVAFGSEAREMVSGDTNRTWDIFVRDLVAGTTERVSLTTGGAEANNASLSPCISADGRFVAFQSLATNLVPGDTNASWDVFVHDRLSSTTLLCSLTSKGLLANSSSLAPAISGDGSRVVFKSTATNLVEGDLNLEQDVFVHDLVKGTTERASIASDGTEPHGFSSQPTISADGESVGFYCVASNVVPLDTNDEPDLFVHVFSRVRRR